MNDISEKSRSSFPWAKVVRWLGTILLIVLIFKKFDVENVFGAISKMHPMVYFLLLLYAIINRSIACFRWKLSLLTQDIDIPYFKLLPIFFYGQALNLVMPSSIGGDSYRIIRVIKDNPNKKTNIAVATIVDRAFGIITLAFILLITTFFNVYIEIKIRIFIIIIVSLGFLSIGLGIYLLSIGKISIVKKILYFKKLKLIFDKFILVINNFIKNKKLTMIIFLVSIGFQISTIIVQYLIFLGLGVTTLPLLYFFYVIPVTNMILVLPISIGGIGLKEFSMTNLMEPIHVSATMILSYSLVGYSFQVIIAIFMMLYESLKGIDNKKHKRDDEKNE